MNVAHVMPDVSRRFGGPTQALVGYVAAAATSGVVSELYAPRPSSEDEGWLRDRLPAGTRLHAVGRAQTAGIAALGPLTLALARNARRHDVVHVHGLLHPIGAAAARVARATSRPLVVRPFGTLSPYTFAHRKRLLKRLWLAAVDAPSLRAAAAVHYTSDAERDEAEWHGLRLLAKAWVVPPPWDGASGAAPRPTGGAETVLYLSRLHPKKGLETLLDAWPAVRTAVPSARLVVAGSGDAAYEAALRERATLRGGDTIRFVGHLDGPAKAAAFADAAAYVLASHHENFGIAPLEAVAAGLPVVVSREVQLAGWILERGVGVVAPAGADGLAGSIVSVLADRPLRDRCAAQGAALVAGDFSSAVIASRLRAMYAAAVGGGPVAAP